MTGGTVGSAVGSRRASSRVAPMTGAAPPHRPGRGRAVAWLLLLTIAAGACVAREGALDPKGPVARDQAELFYIALWTSVGVFAVTTGLLVYAMVRRRRSDDEQRFPSTRFVVVGGIVPDGDEPGLRAAGVSAVYHPGASREEIVTGVRRLAAEAQAEKEEATI
ncbi:MAG: hypothetical protein KY453_08730 [Gemmatimonadetes bacterium]|nr:hypothetical protein [Gemmatimonadota bacterium]